MRTRLVNVLLLALLFLAVTRLWLFLGEPAPSLPAITTGATPPAAVAAKREQQAHVAEYRPEAYDVIVARDLFSPARGVVPPAPSAAAAPAPKPPPAPKLTLYGVVILDGEKTAFLQEGTQEGRPRKVRENENFAGGVVTAIRPDGVTFLFAGSEITVPLRTPKDGVGPPFPRGPDPGAADPRFEAPAAFPRRQMPIGIPQGQMPAPGRPVPAAPGMPTLAPGMPMLLPRVGDGGEIIQDEEFPEGSMPDAEAPGMTEEEGRE